MIDGRRLKLEVSERPGCNGFWIELWDVYSGHAKGIFRGICQPWIWAEATETYMCFLRDFKISNFSIYSGVAIYIYIHTCTDTHTHTCIYIYTYIYTHRLWVHIVSVWWSFSREYKDESFRQRPIDNHIFTPELLVVAVAAGKSRNTLTDATTTCL